MLANVIFIEGIIAEILYFATAPVSFIIMLVCIIRLIIAKKEKRKQMKKVKITAVISAIIVAIIAAVTIYCFIILPPPPPPRSWEIAEVPNMTGFQYEMCKKAYSDMFELVVEEEQYSSEYPEGIIIEQTPAKGSEYLVGNTTVKCKISKGPRMVTVSNVIGLDFEDARTILADNDKFVVGYVSEYSDTVPKGKVIATDPPEFEKAVYGSAVKVTVSGGKEPDVTDGTE